MPSFFAVIAQAMVEFTSPHDDHKIGSLIEADLLERHHDASCLFGMASRADFEINIRSWHTEAVEEGLAHAVVIVLTSVHKNMLEAIGKSV